MGFFNHEFQNKELEEQYKQQQEKYTLKCGLQFILVLTIGHFLFILEYILRNQYILCVITSIIVFSETSVIYLLAIKKLHAQQVLIYTYILYLVAIAAQYINFSLADKDQLQQSQLFVYLDITQQCITLINYGCSPIQNSIFYFIFLMSRIFIQINYEYTIFSLTFAFYGLFFFIDQFSKDKQKRKLFLKGQRNKLFERLIKEFIDEKICIIEKDDENIKFVPIIVNDKLKELSDNINSIIKSLQICCKRKNLQDYLYKTVKNSQTILCQYKNRVFEVKYERIILKKCQIFIKIKEIYHNQSSLINYKELYLMQQRQLKRYFQSSYQTQQLLKQVQEQMFIFWFQKYHLAYKMKVEQITIQQLKTIIFQKDFDIIRFQFNKQYFNTDKILLSLLMKSIDGILLQKQLILQQIENGIRFDMYGVFSLNIKKVQVNLIKKILFHIGFGKNTIIKTKSNKYGHIQIQILNIKQDYIRYE